MGRPSATTSSLRASSTPCWTRSKSLTITFVVTHPPASRQTLATTLSRAQNSLTSRNCLSTREEASCCHPSLVQPDSKSSGPLESGLAPIANSLQVGGSKPRIPVNSLAALTTACKLGVWGGYPIHGPTIRRFQGGAPTAMQSAQLSQNAETRVRRTLLNPKPPNDAGTVTMSCVSSSTFVNCTWRISLRHCNMLSSWVLAKASTASSRMQRNENVTLADAQCANKSQADCTSSSQGILPNKTLCWLLSSPKNLSTNPGCLNGVPRILRPWSSSLNRLGNCWEKFSSGRLSAWVAPELSEERPIDD